ncbi:DUF1501 domain-containing protein [Aeoliella sp.]|uniref:DUF1501 domain-containing protein n=1 Tax=Aeoliella sp. TaxID=2795800 RepID=UPI003CCBD1C9
MSSRALQAETHRRLTELASRRTFLANCTTGVGALWLASQSNASSSAGRLAESSEHPLAARPTQQPGKVKRVIFLHMIGAPSQLELFDYKPELEKYDGKECPAEFLAGERFAFIQGVPRMLGPQYPFAQHGNSGAWISDRLPHLAKQADELCFIKTMQTDQFNHGPAQLMVHSGQPRIGYPSIGSWVTWGLGSENQDLPGFIVLLSGGRLPRVGKALWGSGFLPSVYQGVHCRSQGPPVLNLQNPSGESPSDRRALLDTLKVLNEASHAEFGDPETLTRINQYELAFRMQVAAPDAMDISQEPASVQQLYGADPATESFANNCLLARRLAERGVRFIQLYDWGWDTHGSNESESLSIGLSRKCKQVDQPIAALLADLKQRGMLEDTLVVWSGEFGRTSMRENRGGAEMRFKGRDHNPHAFTLWMAGAGVKSGYTHGETDPLGYNPTSSPVHLRDFHATLLHLMGLDHTKLTFAFQGLKQKLSGVKPAAIIQDILA